MNALDWAGFIVSITTVMGSLAIGVRFLVKHYFDELKPNGGGSIKDQINVNTERLNRVETRVDEIYKLLCEKGTK